MKIAIAVHGRFHAFDLAKALHKRGHDVTLLTNYPRSVCRQFGLDGVCLKTFPIHGLLTRVIGRIWRSVHSPLFEPFLHKLFGRWAARKLRGEQWDCIHCFSGVSEELLSDPQVRCRTALLMRGSAHIEEQAKLLREETNRARTGLELPSSWMIDRELREYQLSDGIVTLSSFARNSFNTWHVASNKVVVLPLGVELDAFQASSDTVSHRRSRILTGTSLRLLYVGNTSYQKGFLDLIDIARAHTQSEVTIRCVGEIQQETRSLCRHLPATIQMIGKVPQAQLTEHYAWADLFVFPTIHDGFAVVLTQALASAVPILTTTNCAGPDLIVEGRHGWVLPIRQPDAFVKKLSWCLNHRPELAKMVGYLYEEYKPRTWDDVAQDFEALVLERI